MSEKSIVEIVNGMDDTTRERVTNALQRAGAGELAVAMNTPQAHTDAHEAVALARASETEWKDIAASRRAQLEAGARDIGQAKQELAHAAEVLAERTDELKRAREEADSARRDVQVLRAQLEKHVG